MPILAPCTRAALPLVLQGLAEAHFPHVESQDGVNLHLVDTLGKRHTFRFRFWINSQSRMYLLEGTQDVQAKFNMGIGDVLVFGRLPDGTYVIHGRKGTKDDNSRRVGGKRGTEGKEGGGGAGKKGGSGRGQKGGESAKSKRVRQAAAAQEVASSYDYWAGVSVPPRRDGVFRALPNSTVHDGNKVVAQYGSWSAVVSLAGELYQAFFDSYDAALAALEAAVQGELLHAASPIAPPPAAPVPRDVEVPAMTQLPIVAAA